MRVVKCTTCGYAAARELPRCPSCRAKSLVYCHSYNTSESAVYQLIRSQPARGSHPFLCLAAVALFTLGTTLVMFSWMFPDKAPTIELPKTLASLSQFK